MSLREPTGVRLLRLSSLSLALAMAAGGLSAAPQHEDASAPRVEESPAALAVTTVIQCTCGGCVNQTLHDCTCGFAAAERERIEQALQTGNNPESIIAAYVAEHGAQIRIVPEKTGLNLIGWAVPFVAAATGGAALTILLLSWRRRGATSAETLATLPAEGDQRYRDRLARDLEEID